MTEGKTRVRHDRVLFVDLELTCWDGPPPPGETPEIIEFGIAELDIETLTVTRSASLLVRPVRSTVSDYCEQLTGITRKRLKQEGRPLAEVLAKLRKDYGVSNKAWMAWGSDKTAVDRDCAVAGLVQPFSAQYHDIGFQFGLILDEGGVGLDRAMEICGVERQGRAHSGLSDAIATAETWAVILGSARREFMPGLDSKPKL